MTIPSPSAVAPAGTRPGTLGYVTVPPIRSPLQQPRYRRPAPPGWPGLTGDALHRPGFLAVAHVPEHPLVAAGRAEVPVHQRALGRGQAGAQGVGHGQHLADRVTELLAAVGV